MTHDNAHLKAWRTQIGWAVRASVMAAVLDPATDVRVKLHFVIQPRRKGDAPDLDKLVRAVLDALTHLAFVDDKQVVAIDARRTLLGPDALASDREGATITVETA